MVLMIEAYVEGRPMPRFSSSFTRPASEYRGRRFSMLLPRFSFLRRSRACRLRILLVPRRLRLRAAGSAKSHPGDRSLRRHLQREVRNFLRRSLSVFDIQDDFSAEDLGFLHLRRTCAARSGYRGASARRSPPADNFSESSEGRIASWAS